MCSVRMIIAAIVPLLAGLPGPAVHAQTLPGATASDASADATLDASAGIASVSRPELASTDKSEAATPATPATPANAANAANVANIANIANAPNGIGIALSATALDDLRGGSELVLNDMQLNGTVANTRAVQVVTGNNSISEGSFANASGLPTVIQNSGANVLIQNATIVNVQFRQ
jgi:hypothetical protein